MCSVIISNYDLSRVQQMKHMYSLFNKMQETLIYYIEKHAHQGNKYLKFKHVITSTLIHDIQAFVALKIIKNKHIKQTHVISWPY
jgi:hypothetical protein